MHHFVTGAVGIGKTTVLRKVLDGLAARPGGFRTYFGDGRFSSREHALYLGPADGPEDFRKEARIALFSAGRQPRFLADAFEERALAVLRDAERFPVILMDECGWMEQVCPRFQRRVAELLNGNTPVLGALRRTEAPSWLDGIRSRPDVRTWTVTAENRDSLPERLLAAVRREGVFP